MAYLLQAETRMHDAAIGEDRHGREVAGTVTSKKHHHTADLVGLRHPTERDDRVQRLELNRVNLDRGVDGSIDGTQPDTDHGDAHERQLDTDSTGKHPHAALGEAVDRVLEHGPVLVDGTDVDDPPARSL